MFRLNRRVITCTTGVVREEVVYGLTSLATSRAHWSIENRSHWVRDVVFDEDRSQVRVGSIPEVMAALRNAVIGLLRTSGHDRIAATCRRLAAQPWAALALLGIPQEN